jgi:hypothetical protein
LCDDISEFESYMASQPVRSLRRGFQVWENRHTPGQVRRGVQARCISSKTSTARDGHVAMHLIVSRRKLGRFTTGLAKRIVTSNAPPL